VGHNKAGGQKGRKAGRKDYKDKTYKTHLFNLLLIFLTPFTSCLFALLPSCPELSLPLSFSSH
jgi:hypothetical protein